MQSERPSEGYQVIEFETFSFSNFSSRKKENRAEIISWSPDNTTHTFCFLVFWEDSWDFKINYSQAQKILSWINIKNFAKKERLIERQYKIWKNNKIVFFCSVVDFKIKTLATEKGQLYEQHKRFFVVFFGEQKLATASFFCFSLNAGDFARFYGDSGDCTNFYGYHRYRK